MALQGRIAAVYTDRYQVWRPDGAWVCFLAGRLQGADRPVVGDSVTFEPEPEGGGTVTAVHERSTVLQRPAPGRKGRRVQPPQVLAANVDQLVVVAALRDPPFRAGLVDRVLVAAARAGLTPVLCLTKRDLDQEGLLAEVEATYAPLGIPVLSAVAPQPDTLEPLRRALAGCTSILVGHSGVGKTSLVNALAGTDHAVGAVGFQGNRGRHTTTTARLLPLPGGGFLIDSPGIREFGLSDVAAADLARYYPDFQPWLGTCSFRDCLHRDEPGCAIRMAVEEHRIHPGRYESYRLLLAELN